MTISNPYALHYTIQRLCTHSVADYQWEGPPWEAVPSVTIKHHMGHPPAHRPLTKVKLLYDDNAIYVRFWVRDRYVIALETDSQSAVCRDSCVELFFSPGDDVSPGYFNIEANCVGTALFHYQRNPQIDQKLLTAEINQLDMRHSINGPTVAQEITKPVTWTLGYRVPFSALEPYTITSRPHAGVIWRANLYKCADRSSHPHWLTWSPVAFERPNFHLKEQFGFFHFA